MSSTPLIGHGTNSLDTGQTEDNAFQLILNWMTLNDLLATPPSIISPW